LSDSNVFRAAKRVVIKVGTSTLTHETGLVNIRRMEHLIKVLADLANSGRQLILVTSGAISVGCGKAGLRERPADIPSRQALAAIGQCELMHLYDTMFGVYNHNVGQILLTLDIVEEELKRRNVVNTFERLLELGCIPIVNENDTVSTIEAEGSVIGDNDTLSGFVAELCHADALVILSDIDGLYDGDPRSNPEARLLPVVESIDQAIADSASGAGSRRGTGGMITKINAAKAATAAGIDMAILNGSYPERLYRLFDGECTGTHFVARKG
jgi:glutamate 5-kinase